MTKKMTDSQLAAARKVFTEFVQKKQSILKNLDNDLKRIFDNYKKELESMEKEKNVFDLDKALKDA